MKNKDISFLFGFPKVTQLVNGLFSVTFSFLMAGFLFLTTEPALAAVSVSFSASPTALTIGTTVNLSWNSTGATSCSAASDFGTWTGPKGSNGLENITVSHVGTESYLISCTDGVTPVSRSVTVLGVGLCPFDFSSDALKRQGKMTQWLKTCGQNFGQLLVGSNIADTFATTLNQFTANISDSLMRTLIGQLSLSDFSGSLTDIGGIARGLQSRITAYLTTLGNLGTPLSGTLSGLLTANYYLGSNGVGFVAGTGDSCQDTSWTPDPASICSPNTFTQTSNCGNTRSSTGTLSCEVDVCGDGKCTGKENAQSCPTDCASSEPVCGDGVCTPPENTRTCFADCRMGR